MTDRDKFTIGALVAGVAVFGPLGLLVGGAFGKAALGASLGVAAGGIAGRVFAGQSYDVLVQEKGGPLYG